MANEYLRRVNTSGGNRRVWTWAGWVKRSNITPAAAVALFSGANPLFNTTGQQEIQLLLSTADELQVYMGTSGVIVDGLHYSAQKFRDCGNWFHLIIAFDSTNIESIDRAKIYLNGVLIPRLISTIIPRNYETSLNRSGFTINVGGASTSGQQWLGEFADVFFVDGQALTPDVFGFYKQGKGYISAGSTQATDFRPGQWVPKTPRVIKTEINRRGGFGVNGFYLPMNDRNNFGADFHGDPNSIITLNEKLPQPRVGIATTAAVGLGFTDVLRADPYAANLVLALPFVSSGLCTNGTNVGVNTGFGDYSAVIKGSGTAKVGIITATSNLSIANTASYYGNSAFFDGNGDYITIPSNSDFSFGTGDFTVEFWMRRFGSGTNVGLLDTRATNGDTNGWFIRFNAATTIQFVDNATPYASLTHSSDWNHIAIVRKSSVLTGYVNGVAGVTTSVTKNFTSSNFLLGGFVDAQASPNGYNGYIQDLRVYKGVAKYTGGFDVPRPYTPVGIATWRAVPDTTANNFCTWNPVSPASDTTFTNGNLTIAYGTSATIGVTIATVGVAVTGAGKYYWENRIDASSISPTAAMIGVWGMSTTTSAANYPGFTNTYGWSYYGNDGTLRAATGGALSSRAYGATYTTGDIIGVTLDMTTNNGSLEFYKNGVSQGVATTGIGTFLTDGKIHAIMPALGDGGGAATYTASSNFGQNPTFSGNVSIGTFTDSNGKGLFKYQPPSGFLALCEDNLPTPAIADPGKYFKTVLYTGDNNAGRSITGIGFTPDLVWVKPRTTTGFHHIFDSVRGATNVSFANSTSAESSTNSLISFNSDGFSLGTAGINDPTQNNVAWCWRAGAGTTSTNTSGTITSVVSVNQDAGFSIVRWTGNGSSTATVGHGLGRTPAFLISKARGGTNDWWVVHKSGSGNLQLNTTGALITSGGANGSMGFPSTLTSSTFTFTNGSSSVNNVNQNGITYVTYCWAEIDGFSKFGSYVGNGSADGPFVYCGFKPAFVMIKNSSVNGYWNIWDSSRNSSNPLDLSLFPNASDVEQSGSNYYVDFLSNGFKIRTSSATHINGNGNTIIFIAFAESPFQTANSK